MGRRKAGGGGLLWKNGGGQTHRCQLKVKTCNVLCLVVKFGGFSHVFFPSLKKELELDHDHVD